MPLHRRGDATAYTESVTCLRGPRNFAVLVVHVNLRSVVSSPIASRPGKSVAITRSWTAIRIVHTRSARMIGQIDACRFGSRPDPNPNVWKTRWNICLGGVVPHDIQLVAAMLSIQHNHASANGVSHIDPAAGHWFTILVLRVVI